MLREYRLKFSGLIFFIILFCIILSSSGGYQWIFQNSEKSGIGGIVIAGIGFVAAIYASESFGYIFNSFFLICWQRIYPYFYYKIKRVKPEGGGHSFDQFRFVDIKIKNKLLRWAEEETLEIPSHLKDYELDIFLAYFMINAPKKTLDAVDRRITAYIVAMTEIVALIAGWIVGVTICLENNWAPTFNWILLGFFSIIFLIVCWYNAIYSKKEATHMVDLWLQSQFNDNVKRTFDHFIKLKDGNEIG